MFKTHGPQKRWVDLEPWASGMKFLTLIKQEVVGPCLFCPSDRSGRKRQGKRSRLHKSVFFLTCREADCQAWGYLPVGARRRAMVGAHISSEHLSRWERAPGGSRKPPKPTLIEKSAEATRSHLPQTHSQFPPKSLIPCIDFFFAAVDSEQIGRFLTRWVIVSYTSFPCHLLSWCLSKLCYAFRSDDFSFCNRFLISS